MSEQEERLNIRNQAIDAALNFSPGMFKVKGAEMSEEQEFQKALKDNFHSHIPGFACSQADQIIDSLRAENEELKKYAEWMREFIPQKDRLPKDLDLKKVMNLSTLCDELAEGYGLILKSPCCPKAPSHGNECPKWIAEEALQKYTRFKGEENK